MAKSSRTGRFGGGGGLNPGDINSTSDLVSQRETNQQMVDEVLSTASALYDEYGIDATVAQFLTAELAPKAQDVIAYYDGANIGVNQRFFNKRVIETAYADSVRQGFHPSNGNKTAMEAVAAHEFGHALTDVAATRMGITGPGALQQAATRIVTEARPQTRHRGVVQMASKISKYATASNAEAIAEAVCDVFCNGTKARQESHAIVNVLNGYVKGR